MKIYTKRGDEGETSLIGGSRVPKYDIQVEAYGTLDELNSYLGLIIDLNNDQQNNTTLTAIQHCLFIAESRIASDSVEALSKMPEIKEKDTLLLENEIDRLSQSIPKLKNFILPGGHQLASYCHIARTICRRAERHTLQAYHNSESIDKNVLKYINRLSDYLFSLARYIAHKQGNGDKIWKTK